jgi:hypothetical protein
MPQKVRKLTLKKCLQFKEDFDMLIPLKVTGVLQWKSPSSLFMSTNLRGCRKIKNLVQVFVILAILNFCLSAKEQAPWPGTGDINEPYQISDANGLNALGADPNYYTANFILTADIDLADITYKTAVGEPDSGFGPAGRGLEEVLRNQLR